MLNQSEVNAARSALYAREAAGEAVSADEWMALGDAQYALDAPTYNRQGYITSGW